MKIIFIGSYNEILQLEFPVRLNHHRHIRGKILKRKLEHFDLLHFMRLIFVLS